MVQYENNSSLHLLRENLSVLSIANTKLILNAEFRENDAEIARPFQVARSFKRSTLHSAIDPRRECMHQIDEKDKDRRVKNKFRAQSG